MKTFISGRVHRYGQQYYYANDVFYCEKSKYQFLNIAHIKPGKTPSFSSLIQNINKKPTRKHKNYFPCGLVYSKILPLRAHDERIKLLDTKNKKVRKTEGGRKRERE